MTIIELTQKINKSKSTTWRAVRNLRKSGYLKRIESTKSGHWEILDKKT